MPESIDNTNPITLMESKRTKHMEISDQDLVSICLDTKITPQELLEGWDEFFRRFVRLIHNKIKSTLWDCADKKDGFWTDEDTIWDIHAELVHKLVKKGILQNCTDLTGLKPWLKTVTENQAVQWLRENGRLRNMPKRNAEDGMLPLEDPLYDDDENITLGDVIKSRHDIYRLDRINLEKILAQLDELKNSTKQTGQRDYWIMRLSIIAQLPLTKVDIADFLQFCPLPETEAKQKLDEMITTTESREKKREAKIGLSIVRESQLRRLESHYNYVSKHDDAKAQQVAEKIEKVAAWQVKLLKEGMVIPRPFNADIAAVVGIDPDQKDYVTRIIQRTREKLTLSEEEKEKTENLQECQILEIMSL